MAGGTLMGATSFSSGGAAGVSQANQAALEAETDEDTYAPPDLIKHSPGVAKCWIKWEASGAHSIVGSYNITSVTDGGQAGDTDGVIATDFSSVNDQVFAGLTDDAKFLSIGTSAAGTWTSRTYAHDGTLSDVDRNMMAMFGDQ